MTRAPQRKLTCKRVSLVAEKQGQSEAKQNDLRWQRIALLQEERCHTIVTYRLCDTLNNTIPDANLTHTR
jgi:hypothetical protein